MSESRQEHPTLWTRGYLLNLVATFAFWFNVDFLLLALPLYMREEGFAASSIGLVFGAAAPGAIVARLLSGRAIDRSGGRLFLLGGAAAWAIGSGAMAFTVSLPVLFGLRLLQGAGLGVFTTASLAYVSYTVTPQQQEKALGWWAAATPTMATLAPVAAALTLNSFGFTAAFFTASIAGLTAFVASLLLPSLTNRETNRSPSSASAVKRKPYVPEAILPGLFGGSVAVASGSFAAFAPLLARERGFENVGLFLTLSALGSILVRFVAGPLAEHKGRNWTVAPGLAIASFALILLGVTSQRYGLFIAPFLFGIGTGAAMPGLLAWAVARSGQEERATAGGTFYAFFEVGLFLGPPVLGVLVERLGFVAFSVPAVLLATALIAYLVVSRR